MMQGQPMPGQQPQQVQYQQVAYQQQPVQYQQVAYQQNLANFNKSLLIVKLKVGLLQEFWESYLVDLEYIDSI